MQLSAYNNENALIFARDANKHLDYKCIECGDRVRLRSGQERQPHFFHIKPEGSCRLNGKGMEHIMTQRHLEMVLPKGEAFLEYRFDEIGRIADVAWPSKKLIFEIQYSPITADEVKARNANYSSIGYQVIWILHEKRFNQRKISAAENILKHSPHYFTNIDAKGEGEIYDEPSIFSKGLRIHSLPKVVITPSLPVQIKPHDNLKIRDPEILLKRVNNWPLGFKGDYLNLYENPFIQDEIDLCIQKERLIKQTQNHRFISWNKIAEMSVYEACIYVFKRWVARPYVALLRHILEKACR